MKPTHEETDSLTTNQGTPISDNQNSLRAGARGPTLLEDFVLREKITHFDHERIPERVVHARGYGAHGFFQSYRCHADLTKAAFLQDAGMKTPVFVRFSTVAGSQGSPDLARDVRGFAVKFYTSQGNFDLVGNNIPVFFIQDAMKFPDLIHSVKPAQDRGFPQAQSAHDTFWDFVSLTPESMHMLMWVMSDRAIPRSFRMMEGFGVHTFRFVDKSDRWNFVKFHWRPKLGSHFVLWDEAVKINGADPDFHRRDLWQAIERGDYPEFEFSVQVFDEELAAKFDFDVLDPTKLIPEELVPLRRLGKMVLDRNVDEFFAETEQVAFCPSHLVPGIDFSEDPLLQGRLFSYLDTQLSRLGSPNFHEIPVNRPQCPMRNFQRGGHMRTTVSQGRVANEPNSLETSLHEAGEHGFQSSERSVSGPVVRVRAESFHDHYSQARLFWSSMTHPERRHIVAAFGFELGKVESADIRTRMLRHLCVVDTKLAEAVAAKLGVTNKIEPMAARVPCKTARPSPALSLIHKAPRSVAGKKIGLLVADGVPRELVDALQEHARSKEATIELVASTIDGICAHDGTPLAVAEALVGAPSVVFDAIVVAVNDEFLAVESLRRLATNWIRDAYTHLKVVGYNQKSRVLLDDADIERDRRGIVAVEPDQIDEFFSCLEHHRVWEREEELGLD